MRHPNVIQFSTTSAEYRFCNRLLEIEKIRFFWVEILIKNILFEFPYQNRTSKFSPLAPGSNPLPSTLLFFGAEKAKYGGCKKTGEIKSQKWSRFSYFFRKISQIFVFRFFLGHFLQKFGGGYGFFAAAPENQRKRAQMTPGERRAHHKVLHRHHKTHLRVPGGHVDCR